MIARAIFWLTFAVYMPLGYFVFQVFQMTGGMVIFDLQVVGYSAAWGQRFLAALPPEGVALYVAWIRPLDTVIPILLASTISAHALRTAPWWKWVCVAVTANTAMLDLIENVHLAALITGTVEPLAENITAASWVTRAKYLSLLTSIILLVAAHRRSNHA